MGGGRCQRSTPSLPNQRRRINTEEKAKVVAAAWATVLIQFLATLAIFHQDDLKKGLIHPILEIVQDDLKKLMNSSYSSNSPGRFEFILIFKSSYSAIHPILRIFLVQFILFKSSWCKVASKELNHAPWLLFCLLSFFYGPIPSCSPLCE